MNGPLMKQCLFPVLFFNLCFSQIASQSIFSLKVDSLVNRGIDQTYNCLFDSAYNTFQKIINEIPDHPIGYFYQANALQSKMMDYETDRWEETFYQQIEKAIQIGIKRLGEGDENPWTYYYVGSSYNYKGLYQAQSGGLVSGFMSARKGLSYLTKALEIDSTMWDAYLGLGSYDYWSARFYKYLSWLPWIGDERFRGISRVRKAIDHGKVSRWVGINSLGWIEYDRKNYGGALNLFYTGIEKFPGSRFFLWGLADTYFQLAKYDFAIDIYKELLTSVNSIPMNNGYNQVVLHFKLVRSYMAQKKYEPALYHCDAIMSKKLSSKITKRVKNEKRYKEINKYRQTCLQELERS